MSVPTNADASISPAKEKDVARLKNRFDFHWERTHIDKTIYRYDNFPDAKFKKIKTNAIKIEIQLPEEYAAGIYEWTVE